MKKSILFMLLLLLISYSVFGQITVSGIVTSEDGALPGATVQIKGTNRGTQTDIEGNFEITVENKNDILTFRFVGYVTKEVKVSEITKEVTLQPSELVEYYIGNHNYTPLIISYWSGFFYNPYGVSVSKSWHYVPAINYLHINTGYSTNFKDNSDFYGVIGTEILKRTIYYKFQQTTFNKSEIGNRITTHLVESDSYFKFIKTRLLYGIGHQTFSKKGIENNQTKNFGINAGLSKYINFARANLSVKSFYWQDYWAWEANLNKEFYYRKLRLNTAISYRQTTQDFKEVNLALGYIF
ncbi:carboxypeptidase-like regulatory domain-containing protein [Bernardetia sp. ABR2-2B]|uniref:carboxypeptidase-like regulatory domain-containing protein n=1 Tax=Bernardetia sp. ABR2-2B TaxID=3127472 RepID=UPI0030D2ED76